MFELKAREFQEATARITRLITLIRARTADKNPLYDRPLDDDDRAFLEEDLAALKEHLTALGARVTSLAITDFEKYMMTADAHWQGVKDDLDDVEKTLQRELTLPTVLVLEPKEQSYFAPRDPLFGAEFAVKFLSQGAFELDEAAKCLALSRPTACVFHLMRVMEIGIRAVARCLNIPDPTRPAERNWGSILGEIHKDLNAHGGSAPTKTWTVAGDRELFEGAYASLDAVRVAWRNPTMHVEKKYTEYEAEHVLVAVKGFMMKLASRCDENGDPKA